MTLEDFIRREETLANDIKDNEKSAIHSMLASLLNELKGFRDVYFSPLDFKSIDSKEWDAHLEEARNR